MGLILDVVPNHMAVDDANRYWADPALRSRFFDLDEETGRHRRFFDVDHLAGRAPGGRARLRGIHRLALRLAREGTVDGLRVDHPDGLADPGWLPAPAPRPHRDAPAGELEGDEEQRDEDTRDDASRSAGSRLMPMSPIRNEPRPTGGGR